MLDPVRSMTETHNVATTEVLVVDNGELDEAWPYLRNDLLERFMQLGRTTACVRLNDGQHLRNISGISHVRALVVFGVEPNPDDIAALSSCRVVAAETDRCGLLHSDALWERDIACVDGTRGWSQSCAEIAIALILMALRRLPYWHDAVLAGTRGWIYPHWQFCDDPNFVNGTLAGKTVAVIGLGEIGAKIASLCVAFGADVVAVDPHQPKTRFDALDIRRVDIGTAASTAHIVAVAVPGGPLVAGVLDAAFIAALKFGAIVVTITRTDCLDTKALRERVYRNELCWATDVYDFEPLEDGDPLVGAPNVVHLPHIAGRTRDANRAVANVLADGVDAILNGTVPTDGDLVTAESVQRRLGAPTLRHYLKGTTL